jgi:hypothetical protein
VNNVHVPADENGGFRISTVTPDDKSSTPVTTMVPEALLGA